MTSLNDASLNIYEDLINLIFKQTKMQLYPYPFFFNFLNTRTYAQHFFENFQEFGFIYKKVQMSINVRNVKTFN